MKRSPTIAIVALILASSSGFWLRNGSCTTTVTVEGKTGSQSLFLSDLISLLYVEGFSSYQNRLENWRGHGVYVGVQISSLVELVGGMSPGDTVIVYAEDGYNQTYCYNNVYNTWSDDEIQGDMLLAFSYNETLVPDWADGLQIAFLPPDGGYSNLDRNQTSSLDQQGPSAGERWMKNVSRIVVESASWAVALVRGDYSITYGDQQITLLPNVTLPGAYKKTTGEIVGPDNYTGVELPYLLQSVNGLASNESLFVNARDNYNLTYTHQQVTGNETVTMILAYLQGGVELSPSSIPKIAFVGPDSPVTDGHLWTKQVCLIEIKIAVKEYTLNLTGAISMQMDRTTFESGVNCHKRLYNDEGQIYEGIALWRLLGFVDDSAPEGFHDFNDHLNYTVTVGASDGYNKTFSFSTVARNDSIIVANTLNGEILAEMLPPLKLAGKLLNSEKIKGVSFILINDITPPTIADVSQRPPKENVQPNDIVEISVRVADDIKEVKKVTLNYTTGNGTWFAVMMVNSVSNYFNATIPSFQNGTSIVYVIIAEDNSGNSVATEELGLNFQYTVIPEFPSTTMLALLALITLFVATVIQGPKASRKRD